MAKEMRSWYGTTMLIRKGWLEESGFDALTAAMVHFPTSQGRALLVLEMKDEQGIAVCPLLMTRPYPQAYISH